MLRQTVPFELSSEEIELYDKAVATYPQSGGSGRVSELIYAGEYGLYIVESSKSRALVVVSINTHPDGTRDLFIVMASGIGSLLDFEYYVSCFKVLAAENDCKRLTGMASARAWEKFSKYSGVVGDGHMLLSFDVAGGTDSQKGRVERNGQIQDDPGMRSSIHKDGDGLQNAKATVESV